MWEENDEMMELLNSLGNQGSNFPTPCPLCGANDAHVLLHRYKSESDYGSAWMWCSNCLRYAHVGYRVPVWWKNPSFIEDDRLDSFVDYPESIKAKIDEWINGLHDQNQ